MPDLSPNTGGHPRLDAPTRRIRRITFSAPERANCLGPADLQTIVRHLDNVEADEEAGVLVFAAQGRHFSAGFDLQMFASRTDSISAHIDDFEQTVDRIEATRLITIAAVDGPALGGATDLLLACDFRVGSSKASMTMPAARFGLPLYAGALRRYVSRLGIDQAKRLVFLAPTIAADEMLALGALTELVDPDGVDERVMAIASEIVMMPSAALSAMKASINAMANDAEVTVRMQALLGAAFDGPAIAQRVDRILHMRRTEKKAS